MRRVNSKLVDTVVATLATALVGRALVALVGPRHHGESYHIYIGLLHIFGLVPVYCFVWMGSHSRPGA